MKMELMFFSSQKQVSPFFAPLWRLFPSAGIKLHFKEEAVATACVFYHTFCSSMSGSDYDKHVNVAILSWLPH